MKEPLKVLDVCSGIGGFSLGLESTGYFQTAAFIEVDSFCQRVLARHWPNIPIYGDIHNVSASTLSGQIIDVITAGFPCQPFSKAGARRGTDDPRFLWPEVARLISEIRPRYVFLENVPDIRSIDRGLVHGNILGFLASHGYHAEWCDFRALDFGAPHIRERWVLVAYRDELRRGESATVLQTVQNPKRHMASSIRGRQQLYSHISNCEAVAYVKTRRREFHVPKAAAIRKAKHFNAAALSPAIQSAKRPHQSRMGRNDDGFSKRVDGHRFPAPQGRYQYPWEPSRTAPSSPEWRKRVAALGNAFMPQIVAQVGRQIAAHAGLK